MNFTLSKEKERARQIVRRGEKNEMEKFVEWVTFAIEYTLSQLVNGCGDDSTKKAFNEYQEIYDAYLNEWHKYYTAGGTRKV